MARLGISYELLARESEILHLKFWDAAFELLKKSGIVQLVSAGKMAGCWIMPWKEEVKDAKEVKGVKAQTEGPNAVASLSFTSSTSSDDEENIQDKIIVRSNGTVTYVGKDIAYQLWKFGLLGKDFNYRKWPGAPEGETVWATTTLPSDSAAPHFAEPATAVYNVIDTRQSYVQDVVAEALRRLGHAQAADKSIHLSYAFVVLSPRCAAEMGYELSPEEAKIPFIQVSGRKGFGVKADDLIDKLEAATLAEVQQRHAEMSAAEQKHTSHAIAVGALRFFLLKFTRNAIIAFDFKDALSFEGETGPYCQYAVVRIRGIRRKGVEAGATNVPVTQETVTSLFGGPEGNGLWELLLSVGSLDLAVDAAIAAQEPAFVAKYAFQLAQAFNNFYHKHHILTEADEQKRAFLLRLTELVEAQLVRRWDCWESKRRKKCRGTASSPLCRAQHAAPLQENEYDRQSQYDMTRWTRVRSATPVGPLASQGLASSFQAVPAMSRWIQGESPVNSLMNMAPVMAPPPLPLPIFWMSATVPLMNSR